MASHTESQDLVITIMAAGEGKRMNSPCPKVLHLFLERPILVRIIETAMLLSPKKIIVIIGKHDELIKQTLSQYINTTRIIFVNQPVSQGTGDAIRCCLPHYQTGEKVLILNGDMPLLTDDIMNLCTKGSIDMRILVAKFENPKGYGRIIYDNNNEFIGIVEEKDCTPEERKIDIINTGLYFISAEILKTYIPMIENTNAQCEYYLTDIVKIARRYDARIDTLLIDPIKNILIRGVNTQDELLALEEIARPL